jgi:inorganic pyrophosphatase
MGGGAAIVRRRSLSTAIVRHWGVGNMGAPLGKLRPVAGEDGKNLLNVVVETPKGQRNKFKFEPKLEVFTLSKVLPAGATFPFDFGFVPGTLADDGDPVDVLLLMDEPAFTGCLVRARLIGVIEAQQRESDGTVVENDRLIAVAGEAHDYAELHSPDDLNPNLLKEYEHFFASYHALNGTEFKVQGVGNRKQAKRLVKEAARRAKKSRPQKQAS